LAATASSSQAGNTLHTDPVLKQLIFQVDSLQAAWQSDAALVICEEALKRAEASDAKNQLAEIYNRIGQIHFNLSQYRKALSTWETALTCSQQSGDRNAESETLCELGMVYLYLPDFHKTLSYCQKSLDICRETGFRKTEAKTLYLMGIAWQYLAYYSDALDCYQSSLKLYRELGDRRGEGEAILNIGNLYYLLCDYNQAREYDQLSLEIFRETGDRLNEAYALMNLGSFYIKEENIDKALEVFNHTLQISREIGNRYAEARSLRGIAGAHYYYAYFLTQEYRKHYQKVLDYDFEALNIFRGLGCRFQEARVLESIGVVYMQIPDSAKTMEYYQRCLQIYEDLDADEYVHHVYGRIGFHYARNNYGPASIEYLQKAIDIIEELRSRITDETHRNLYMDDWHHAYEYITCAFYTLGEYPELYRYEQKSRARSFLDMLASDSIKVGKSRHAEFLQREEEYRKTKIELEKQIAATDDTVAIAELRGKIEDEWQSINAMIEDRKRYEPELVSLVTADVLELDEIQNLLDPQTTIIEYFNGAGWQFIWVITTDHAELYKFDISIEALAEKVKGWRDAIMTGGDYITRSRELYDLLIAPVENKIKTRNLIIIPYDSMHYLPFQSLMDGEGRYLVEKYCISYLPSASVLKFVESKRSHKSETLLALGNPKTDRQDYKPLPFAEREVRDVVGFIDSSRLFIGSQATEDNFRHYAPEYDILHLACHSELNSSYPLFSSLLLSPGEEHDGNLEVYELFTMDIDADMVVLSACQTALGHLTRAEELVGLVRAFMYAGTPTVISSLWVIKDESTAYLMTEFYKNLNKYSKAEALRRAQLQTMKEYPSPYHWASFVLIGDPG